MDGDSTDFCVNPSPKSRFWVIIRRSWVVLLAFAAVLIPSAISYWRSHPPKPEASLSPQKLPESQHPNSNGNQAGNASSPVSKPASPSQTPSSGASPEAPPVSPVATTSPAPAEPSAPPVSSTPAKLISSSSGTSKSSKDLQYRVRTGDTLSGIALRYRVSSAEIVAANHLKGPNNIFAGQLLTLPNVSEERLPSPAAKGTSGTPDKTGPAPKADPPVTPAAPQRTPLVLGPPAPAPVKRAPLPASGDSKTAAKPEPQVPVSPGPQHQIVLGPPVSPEIARMLEEKAAQRAVKMDLPASHSVPAPLPPSALAGNLSSSPGAKPYPNPADYPPLIDPSPRQTVNAASVMVAGPDQTLPTPQTPVSGLPVRSSSPVHEARIAGLIAYVVQPFDTPYSIAHAHSTTPERILELNHITALQEGQTILIPIAQNRIASPAAHP